MAHDVGDSGPVYPRCVLCGTDNSREAMVCASCSAPMALYYDSQVRERDPRLVSVMGESNVGKTVYLGFLLDMLSRRAGDFEAVPVGAYSIEVQQTVISHMSHRGFPPKTPMEPNRWYWAYYQVRRRKPASGWFDLVMPDMAGESLAAEVAAPETFRVVSNLITKSAGTLLLVDAGLAASGSARPDFFGLKMVSYIDSLHESTRDERISTPVAVVLCKSDYCPECFDNPREFARANLHRLWNLCESRFENVAFFSCSVVGALGYAMAMPEAAGKVVGASTGDGDRAVLTEWERQFAGKEAEDELAEEEDEVGSVQAASTESEHVIPVPLHTALQGVLEPFEWIVDQI